MVVSGNEYLLVKSRLSLDRPAETSRSHAARLLTPRKMEASALDDSRDPTLTPSPHLPSISVAIEVPTDRRLVRAIDKSQRLRFIFRSFDECGSKALNVSPPSYPSPSLVPWSATACCSGRP